MDVKKIATSVLAAWLAFSATPAVARAGEQLSSAAAFRSGSPPFRERISPHLPSEPQQGTAFLRNAVGAHITFDAKPRMARDGPSLTRTIAWAIGSSLWLP
jgi:hypothetical protein